MNFFESSKGIAEVARLIYTDNSSILGKGVYSPPELQYSQGMERFGCGRVSGLFYSNLCRGSYNDFETGDLTIDHLTLAHEYGLAINRKGIEGQLEGSMCHESSEALFEEMIFDNKWRLMNPTL